MKEMRSDDPVVTKKYPKSNHDLACPAVLKYGDQYEANAI